MSKKNNDISLSCADAMGNVSYIRGKIYGVQWTLRSDLFTCEQSKCNLSNYKLFKEINQQLKE